MGVVVAYLPRTHIPDCLDRMRLQQIKTKRVKYEVTAEIQI